MEAGGMTCLARKSGASDAFPLAQTSATAGLASGAVRSPAARTYPGESDSWSRGPGAVCTPAGTVVTGHRGSLTSSSVVCAAGRG
eukprot:CAMPEP_0171256688 /NCGR_PEP_ID=MMETSP0790-20130122/53442_1 /TAXON_ID=2925 /ORGANISM="Alexandrium catenella, Strain OF101" /LENGTH=84 /DNA_ID=CAMNT_0011724741 /DNA_START=160 /DNA_END=411 /DNA_ORIENTATION=+